MTNARIKHERDLASIAAKDPSMYEDVPLAVLVVYSLYWLHEWELRRSDEAVSILSWRLFPAKFAMVGWPQYPDTTRTTRSLLQCRPKYRNWLTGASSQGFSLNERGMQVARELIERLGPPATSAGEVVGTAPATAKRARKGGLPRSIQPEREVQVARKSRLFEKWRDEVMSERDLIHVHALLGIFEHTPTKLREKRMRDLERAAMDIGDREMIHFLSDVRHNFPSVFR